MWLWVKTDGIPFSGRCTTHFRTHFSGWIALWGITDLEFDPWPRLPQQSLPGPSRAPRQPKAPDHLRGRAARAGAEPAVVSVAGRGAAERHVVAEEAGVALAVRWGSCSWKSSFKSGAFPTFGFGSMFVLGFNSGAFPTFGLAPCLAWLVFEEVFLQMWRFHGWLLLAG